MIASGKFPVIGLHLVVPLRARRVGSYKAELVAESRRLVRVPFRSGAVAEEALSSITVCGVVFVPRYPSAEPPTPCPRPRSVVSDLE